MSHPNLPDKEIPLWARGWLPIQWGHQDGSKSPRTFCAAPSVVLKPRRAALKERRDQTRGCGPQQGREGCRIIISTNRFHFPPEILPQPLWSSPEPSPNPAQHHSDARGAMVGGKGCSNPTGRSQWDAEKWGMSHPRDRGNFVLLSTSKSL